MRKIIFVFWILSILIGCKSENKKEINYNEFLSYNEKTKSLTIDFNKLSKSDINVINLITKRNLMHTFFLDSMKQIKLINNGLKVRKEGYLKNTWYSFDKQCCLKKDYSFYYDSYMLSNNIDTFYVTYDILFNLFGGEHYAVVGDYDEYFNLNQNAKIDTFWQKKDSPLINIPINVKKMKKGKHNIKFIVYEDKRKGNTISRNTTFVDRDYFIEFEK
jgi:hypothetical protein